MVLLIMQIPLIEKGERKVVRVVGSAHKIVVEEFKDKALTGEKNEKRFKLKINESAKINILAMINNANECIDKIN